jgi:hypothetical protein
MSSTKRFLKKEVADRSSATNSRLKLLNILKAPFKISQLKSQGQEAFHQE